MKKLCQREFDRQYAQQMHISRIVFKSLSFAINFSDGEKQFC
jgi:hypothetical protein